ncbi:hypothetical protein ES703_41673 [subsurface metagenome]
MKLKPRALLTDIRGKFGAHTVRTTKLRKGQRHLILKRRRNTMGGSRNSPGVLWAQNTYIYLDQHWHLTTKFQRQEWGRLALSTHTSRWDAVDHYKHVNMNRLQLGMPGLYCPPDRGKSTKVYQTQDETYPTIPPGKRIPVWKSGTDKDGNDFDPDDGPIDPTPDPPHPPVPPPEPPECLECFDCVWWALYWGHDTDLHIYNTLCDDDLAPWQWQNCCVNIDGTYNLVSEDYVGGWVHWRGTNESGVEADLYCEPDRPTGIWNLRLTHIGDLYLVAYIQPYICCNEWGVIETMEYLLLRGIGYCENCECMFMLGIP